MPHSALGGTATALSFPNLGAAPARTSPRLHRRLPHLPSGGAGVGAGGVPADTPGDGVGGAPAAGGGLPAAVDGGGQGGLVAETLGEGGGGHTVLVTFLYPSLRAAPKRAVMRAVASEVP